MPVIAKDCQYEAHILWMNGKKSGKLCGMRMLSQMEWYYITPQKYVAEYVNAKLNINSKQWFRAGLAIIYFLV